VFPDRDHFGRIFYNQTNLSAKGIPQIAVVMEFLHGEMARMYLRWLADIISVLGPGHDFSRQAAAGEKQLERKSSAEDLGGGDVHTRLSGVVDHLAQNDLRNALSLSAHHCQ
jgi:3-methylcrotonyl-CoA carboxylase beta subunit